MIYENRIKKIKDSLKKYPYFEILGKGKRGEVYKISNGLVVKIKKDDSDAIDNIKNEYDILMKLKIYDYFPKPVYFDKKLDYLIREFVDGVLIDKIIDKQIFIKALKMCRILDKEKINQTEMTNPYKHIFVNKKNIKMIDFERARISNNPKNVTQFLQYIYKKFGIRNDSIKNLAKKYKDNPTDSNFRAIIKILKELII